MLDPFTGWNERAQRPETHVLLGSASPTSLPACTGAGPHFPSWGLGTHSVHYLLEQRHRWGAGVCGGGGGTSCPTAPSLPSLHLIPEDEKLTVASAGDSWCQDLPRPSGAGSLETLHPFRLL